MCVASISFERIYTLTPVFVSFKTNAISTPVIERKVSHIHSVYSSFALNLSTISFVISVYAILSFAQNIALEIK